METHRPAHKSQLNSGWHWCCLSELYHIPSVESVALMGLYKHPQQSIKAERLTGVLSRFHKKAMKVFRKSRVDNSGAFPRLDDSTVFVKLDSPKSSKVHVPFPEDEDVTDQEVTTPSFDMSTYEDNWGLENSVFGMGKYAEREAHCRFTSLEEIESDKIVLLSPASSETRRKIIMPRRFRGRIRLSMKPLKKGWKKVTSWRQDRGAGRHTGISDSQTEEIADLKNHWGFLNRSFSDWTSLKMSVSHSAEHLTHKIAASSSSNDGCYESEFDAMNARAGPAQFFPRRQDGLGRCTTL